MPGLPNKLPSALGHAYGFRDPFKFNKFSSWHVTDYSASSVVKYAPLMLLDTVYGNGSPYPSHNIKREGIGFIEIELMALARQ